MNPHEWVGEVCSRCGAERGDLTRCANPERVHVNVRGMKLAWATDVHLDHALEKQRKEFYDSLRPLREVGGALLLTGDIAEGPTVRGFLEEMIEAAGHVYAVLGNHDYYRGSIADVRRSIGKLEPMGFCFLTSPYRGAGIIHLDPKTALIGHDGWYDAQHGHPERWKINMNDWRSIQDLKGLEKAALLSEVRKLALDSAIAIADRGRAALEWAEKLLVATHVPPFPEAATYRNKQSDDDWAPWFTNKALGDALLALADAHPTKQIHVLCGHSHGSSDIHPRPNLRVTTGAAQYRFPELQPLTPWGSAPG